MIVSIGLFTIVLFIATSAFLTVVNADRKSRATRIATDNLNLALEDMQRRIRTGSTYYCGALGTDVGGTGNCATTPGDTLSFTEQDGTRTTYTLDSANKKIKRVRVAGSLDVTAPEISITSLKFIVQGTSPASGAGGPPYDLYEPFVVIFVGGSIGGSATNPAGKVDFKIQTTVTQRNYDS